MPLAVGACVGRVVRQLPNGIAVKFVEQQTVRDLDRMVSRAVPAAAKADIDRPEPADRVRRQRMPRQPGPHPRTGCGVLALVDSYHRRGFRRHAGPFCPVGSILPRTKMKCCHQFSGTSYRSSSVGQPFQKVVLKYDG